MQREAIRINGKESRLAKEIGHDVKDIVTIAALLAATILFFFLPIVSCIMYLVVALLWIIPDLRVEKSL